MAKMYDWVPKERLGTSRLNLKIYPYDPTSKFQELEIGSDLTFMQSKIKICKADFSQTKKCKIKNSSKSVLPIFLKHLALNAIHPYKSIVKISS